jgi:hypothetical protein
MPDHEEEKRELKHELANEKQKKEALQSLLKRASAEIENLAEADCADEQTDQALRAAKTFRRAANL